MGKLKSTRIFNGEKYTYVGGRNTKSKAKQLAAQGRANGYKARVIKATPTALKQRSSKYQVWGSVKKRRKR